MGKRVIYSLTPNRTTAALSNTELAAAGRLILLYHSRTPRLNVCRFPLGFLSAVPTTLATGPFERIKVLLQIQGQGAGAGPSYSGPVDVVRQLYKEGGLRSIFRGTGATLARDGPGSAA
jgi:solute carrier family 25 carnitine/acylcarnitine transporter 20/29